MVFYIHAVVQNADNFYIFTSLAVEDEMTAYMILAVSSTNIITGPTLMRLLCQHVKRVIELPKIFIPLLTAPSILSITANGFKVRSGFRGEAETGHQLGLSVSSSFITASRE